MVKIRVNSWRQRHFKGKTPKELGYFSSRYHIHVNSSKLRKNLAPYPINEKKKTTLYINLYIRHQLYGHLPPITKTIQVRRTRHAGHCWRSRDELIRDVLLWTPTHGRAKAGRPARTYIQQLCEDTGCCPEDLPRAMNDRGEWRERARDIRATSAIWWWWYSLIILVAECFPHRWPLCASIPFLILPFLSILVLIAWQFQLPIVVEAFWAVVSRPSDIIQQLHWFTCCLWTLWHVQLSETSISCTPQSRPSIHSTLELSRFRCAHVTIFPAWIFPYFHLFFSFCPSLPPLSLFLDINLD